MEYQYITNEQKIEVIKSHIMAIERDIYSSELSIEEYSSSEPVDEAFLNLIRDQIDQKITQKQVLLDRLSIIEQNI